MRRKEFLNNKYNNFGEFMAIATSNELNYVVLNSNFTSYFNKKMKSLMEELEKRYTLAGLTSTGIIFNTNGEVVIIDSHILSNFISDRYEIVIRNYYKNAHMNKIIYSVINGTDKTKIDFLKVSYKIIEETLREIFKDIKYRREICDKYNNKSPIEIITSLIIDDMYTYLKICKRHTNDLTQ